MASQIGWDILCVILCTRASIYNTYIYILWSIGIFKHPCVYRYFMFVYGYRAWYIAVLHFIQKQYQLQLSIYSKEIIELQICITICIIVYRYIDRVVLEAARIISHRLCTQRWEGEYLIKRNDYARSLFKPRLHETFSQTTRFMRNVPCAVHRQVRLQKDIYV